MSNARTPTLRLAATLLALTTAALGAQDNGSMLAGAMHWRSIGPLRGGRTKAAAGDPTRPYTFYMAQVNGGVWKTNDAGRTWTPIFDDQPTQSVGAIAVAASDPNTIYVGSGEGLPRPDLSVGDGLYKSTDAGRTWTHLGLRDAQQIPQIAIDPVNPYRIFVAVLGHPYGPSAERGIYRSADGGQTFTLVLKGDENTGGNDVDIDPTNPMVVYANLWEQRQGPWENAAWTGNGGGLFKSTDGGDTWTRLGNGLPAHVNQVNLAIAPSNPNRLYASVASNDPDAVGLYRSDDAGATWTKITADPRPAARIGGGDLSVPVVNPKDPDMVLVASTVSMKSVDGGKTWAPFKGAPGGDDYQNLWISPVDPNIILLVSDQGAVVSLNGGQTWSSWYNQPTAQLYHVQASNSFPYYVCSGQQESGSACVNSRGNWGEITERDWWTVSVDEYGYVAPDPLNPDVVFGGREVSRFDRRTTGSSLVGPLTGQQQGFSSPPGYRRVRTQPVVFSKKDPHLLLSGNNYVWKTVNGGQTWTKISPDLTRTTWTLPASVGKYSDPSLVKQRGVVYAIGPSPLDVNVIWAGTDDGQIQVTRNGGATWTNVTPPQMGPWWKVFQLDAGHFDTQTAYAAVNTLRIDDMRPHFFKTHDGGKTWTDISNVPPPAANPQPPAAVAGPANALREDPVRRGLLYAATDKGVYVSFDDGVSWQSLQLNLPHSSIRDLIVKDDDIVVATHGRGFWILDDVTPLRQIPAGSGAWSAMLFKPTTAWRVRWNTNSDTPLPPDEPMGENPAEGASINYALSANAPVTLEVLDSRGRVVRRYASTDSAEWKVPDDSNAPVPRYWYRQPQTLSGAAGLHRFYWDVRYQPLPATAPRGPFDEGLPIAASPHNTRPGATTPWVAPGTYTARLTVSGKAYTAPIVVKADPRATASPAAMREVYALTDSMYWTLAKLQAAATDAGAMRAQLTDSIRKARLSAVLDAPAKADTGAKGTPLANAPAARTQAPPPGPTTIAGALAALAGQLTSLTDADVPATASQRAAIRTALTAANQAIARWNALRAQR